MLPKNFHSIVQWEAATSETVTQKSRFPDPRTIFERDCPYQTTFRSYLHRVFLVFKLFFWFLIFCCLRLWVKNFSKMESPRSAMKNSSSRSWTMIETKIDEGGNQIVDLKNLLIIFFIVIMLVLLATFGLVIATYYIMDANTNDDGHITDIGGTPLLSSESVITIDNSTGPAGIHCSLTVLEDTPLLAMSDVSGKFSQGGGVGTIRLNKHTTYEFPAGNGQTMIILQGDRFRVLSTQVITKLWGWISIFFFKHLNDYFLLLSLFLAERYDRWLHSIPLVTGTRKSARGLSRLPCRGPRYCSVRFGPPISAPK